MHDRFNPLQRLILDHMERTGETYTAIAARAGMPRQTISYLMNRPAAFPGMPQPDTIRRLARGLQVPRAVVQNAAAASVSVTPAEPTPNGAMLAQLVEALPESDVLVLLATARAMIANASVASATAKNGHTA